MTVTETETLAAKAGPESSDRIAILGAGPVGLEAALAAAEAGRAFVLYERAADSAGAVRSWGHVRLFSPWRLNASKRARRRLAALGHEVPAAEDACPTGAELVDELLEPLATLPEIAPHLRCGTEVVAVSREGLLKNDEIGTGRRAEHPFRLLLRQGDREWTEPAAVVLDCTGTYGHPNALGDGGIPAPGEAAAAERIHRTLPGPATLGAWAAERILLVGGGHSAQTAARDLAGLARKHPGTRVVWALRNPAPAWAAESAAAEQEDDPLPERGRLALDAGRLMRGTPPGLEARTGRVVEAVAPVENGLRVTLRKTAERGSGELETLEVDRILSLTGFVGDPHLYRQLQVHECYATSGPMKLAAALLGESSSGGAGGGDCLAQVSHGPETLTNPEPDFFILGSKSYGRTNTFLMRQGWQQVEDVFTLLSQKRPSKGGG